MSVKIVQQVFERSLSKGNDRLVLIAIADEANDEGTNAWPSLDTIAFKAGGIDERTARRCIRNLEELGELRVDLNAGGNAEWRGDRRPNLYTVLLAHKPKRQRAPKRHARHDRHDEGAGCPPANDTDVVPQVTTGGHGRPLDGGTDCPLADPARGDTSAPHGGANPAARGGAAAPLPKIYPCTDPSSPKPPHSGGSTPRSSGTNPRALGTSPRDAGTNRRAQDFDEIFATDVELDPEPAPPAETSIERARAALGGRTR